MQLSLTLATSVLALLNIASANYADTCPGYAYISGTTFYTQCYNDAGQLVDASIDLNNCVANYNGQLACVHGNGGYSASCSGCEIVQQPEYIECGCANEDGGYTDSIGDLGTCIDNQNGVLAC